MFGRLPKRSATLGNVTPQSATLKGLYIDLSANSVTNRAWETVFGPQPDTGVLRGRVLAWARRTGMVPTGQGVTMTSVIAAAYNQCRVDESLQHGDPRYVPLSERGVRGTDRSCIEFLHATITLNDRPTQQLFSGFRGSGKTTELNWLTKRLTDGGYEVVFVDSEEFLNLREPASVTDLLITVAAGFDRHLGGKPGEDDALPFTRFWNRLHAFLGTEITVEGATVVVPQVGALDLAFKGDRDFKRRFDAAVKAQSRLPELAHECQDFVDECLAQIARRRPGSAGTVLILDSFEKLRGDLGNAEEVRQSVEDVLVRDWKYLELPCHVIYTVPPWLAFMEAAVGCEFGRAHILPMCKVHEPAPGGIATPSRDGIAAMMELLDLRMDLAALFEDAAVLEPLVLASGGYPRDLLRMVRELLLRIKMESEALPVAPEPARALVDRVIAVHTGLFEAPINTDNLELLIDVGRTRKISGHGSDDLQRLADLFDHHFVLCYHNGQPWFDLHPLVRRTATVRAALAEAEEANGRNSS